MRPLSFSWLLLVGRRALGDDECGLRELASNQLAPIQLAAAAAVSQPLGLPLHKTEARAQVPSGSLALRGSGRATTGANKASLRGSNSPRVLLARNWIVVCAWAGANPLGGRPLMPSSIKRVLPVARPPPLLALLICHSRA